MAGVFIMKKNCAIFVLALCGTCVANAPAHAFSAAFSWAGISPCGSTSPAFTISGAPKETAGLRFEMRDYNAVDFRHGGSVVPYNGKGQVARGAISYIGPCPPGGQAHRYVWTIEALDSSGKILGTAKAEGKFPQ